MKELQERIKKDGNAINEDILKVDSFINHQVDPELMAHIGEEFANHFKNRGITKIATFTSGILLILFTLFIVLNLINSKVGRAVTAIRDNRIAAESVGIGITRYKLTAFITSAFLAGMAGAMYAMNFSTIAAKKFDFNTSILILVFVVLGGMSNIPGTIIATAALYMLPELLRGLADYRMLIYAIVLIIVMLLTNSEKAKQMREVIAFKLKNKKNSGQEVN